MNYNSPKSYTSEDEALERVHWGLVSDHSHSSDENQVPSQGCKRTKSASKIHEPEKTVLEEVKTEPEEVKTECLNFLEPFDSIRPWDPFKRQKEDLAYEGIARIASTKVIVRKEGPDSGFEIDLTLPGVEPLATWGKRNFPGARTVIVKNCVEPTKTGVNHFIELTSDAPSAKYEAKRSVPTKSEEKLTHNVDKNLLEHLTTDKMIQKQKYSKDLVDLLKAIHNPKTTGEGKKKKLTNQEKETYWSVIKDMDINKKALKHFKGFIYNNEYLPYYFSKYISNIRKKVLNYSTKIPKMEKMILSERENLLTASKKEFEKILKGCDASAKVLIQKNAGEAAETTFLNRMFERRLEILGNASATENEAPTNVSIRSILEEAITDACMFKVLPLLVDRDAVYKSVEELAKTRLITILKEMEEKSMQEYDCDKKKKIKK